MLQDHCYSSSSCLISSHLAFPTRQHSGYPCTSSAYPTSYPAAPTTGQKPPYEEQFREFSEMRLINCENMLFEEFFFKAKPPYAILSHMWNEHEITYQEYYDFQARARHPEATSKIFSACKKAHRHGLKYIWIDSCCIDKKSSSELTESINSMFKWYEDSQACYVYLADFDSGLTESRAGNAVPFTPKQLSDFGNARWFTRGWTLQELLAPNNVMFYDSQWTFFGRMDELASHVSKVSRIPQQALLHTTPLFHYTIAQKMSWISLQSTTREEDMAYCLFGIFDVNLPLFYGEGGKRAFIRLQQAIMKESNDLSLFAWMSEDNEFYRGILARSPKEFLGAGEITSLGPISANPEYSMTNKGLKIDTMLRRTSSGAFLPLNCRGVTQELGIYLKAYAGLWVRDLPNQLTHGETYFLDFHESICLGNTKYIIKDVRIPKSEDLGPPPTSLISCDVASWLGPPQIPPRPEGIGSPTVPEIPTTIASPLKPIPTTPEKTGTTKLTGKVSYFSAEIMSRSQSTPDSAKRSSHIGDRTYFSPLSSGTNPEKRYG